MSNCINIYNINKMSDKSPIKNIKPLINVKNSSNDNNKSFLTEKIKIKKSNLPSENILILSQIQK